MTIWGLRCLSILWGETDLAQASPTVKVWGPTRPGRYQHDDSGQDTSVRTMPDSSRFNRGSGTLLSGGTSYARHPGASGPSRGGPGRRAGFSRLVIRERSQTEAVPPGRPGVSRVGLVAVGALVAGAIVLVGLSLRDPGVPEYPPSPVEGRDAFGTGPYVLTVDASDPDRWRYVNLARGTVAEYPSGAEWDLAFRRFEARINGGDGFPGVGGVLDLGSLPLDSVLRLPSEGYAGMTAAGRDTSQTLLEDWYSYSFTSHVLQARDRTLGVRTAMGKHAALRFLSYYCPGAQPGCVTMRYLFVPTSSDGAVP